MNYQKAYKVLLGGITAALAELDKVSDKNLEMIRAEIILKNVQLQTEDMYIEDE